MNALNEIVIRYTATSPDNKNEDVHELLGANLNESSHDRKKRVLDEIEVTRED